MLLNSGVGEDSWEIPLDCKEIQPVNPKGNQSWIFIGRTDAEAETPIIWPLGVKNWLIWKDPDARKDWRQEERGTTEDEMVGWHHWLSGHEFETALGVGDGQGSLACCDSWGCKESDTTELNWTEHLHMEFRKMVMTTLYARQQKRHRYKEQTLGLWEKARVGWFERRALKHIYYHMWNRSLVQVWCMRQGAQGWCTGMTLRDRMGREVGWVQARGHMCTHGWFMSMYAKNHCNTIK